MSIKTNKDKRNTTAKIIVMRSRFFSTMLVPVWVEYIEDAIMSEMPVPLPECSKMKTINPTPDTTRRMSTIISSGDNELAFQ